MARVKLSVLYPSLSTSSPTHVGQHRHADASSSSCLASPTVAASPRSPPSRLETGGGQGAFLPKHPTAWPHPATASGSPALGVAPGHDIDLKDRKSTRLNSSHITISYA